MNFFNKKTIIIFSCLLGFPIVLLLFLALFRGCSNSYSYSKYQSKMVEAAEKYSKEKKKLPKNDGGKVIIDLLTLEENKYIKKSSATFKNENCSGTVTVQKNGDYYLYIPDLKCDSYKTEHLINKLLQNVVETKDGLYKINDNYIYKGRNVNNYVSIKKNLYRIVSIDQNNILKLVKVKNDGKTYTWDKKYNVDLKQRSGKNNYSDSNIREVLDLKYDQMSKNEKKHYVAYDLCIGKRSTSNRAIDNIEECSDVLQNQFIGLLIVPDFAMASYDPDCTDIKSGACQNYNYLYETLNGTWLLTGVSNNSYDVYYYSGGYVSKKTAYYDSGIHYVVYINGDEIYTKGDGSKANPYIIGD